LSAFFPGKINQGKKTKKTKKQSRAKVTKKTMQKHYNFVFL